MVFERSFIATQFRPWTFDKSHYFSTEICDLGLHFVTKSNYFSNTQTSRTRPIINGIRSSVAYSSTNVTNHYMCKRASNEVNYYVNMSK